MAGRAGVHHSVSAQIDAPQGLWHFAGEGWDGNFLVKELGFVV